MEAGLCLIPVSYFFSLYGERVKDEPEDKDGLKIGRMNINDIQYAYDAVPVADTRKNKNCKPY